LDGEDAVELAVVGLRPQMVSVRDVDELCRDPHAIAGLADASLQHVRHVELRPHLGDSHRAALERERRGPCRHAELGNPGEHVEQLLGEAIGEILVLRIRAHVHERKHGDRARVCRHGALLCRVLILLPTDPQPRGKKKSDRHCAKARPHCAPRVPGGERDRAGARPSTLEEILAHPLEVGQHLSRRLVPEVAGLFQCLGNDLLQLAGNVWIEAHGGHGIPVEDRLQDLARGLAREGQAPGRHLVENRAEEKRSVRASSSAPRACSGDM